MAPLSILHLAWIVLLLGPVCSLQNYDLSDSSTAIRDVTVGEPLIVRRSHCSFIESSPGIKNGELISCMRLRIPSVSRLKNLGRYANSFRVKVEASALTSAQGQLKTDVCFHGNGSLALGQCSKENWHSLDKGSWNSLMSPFETRFLDIRIRDSITDAQLNVTVEDEFWPFRLAFLGCGLILLLVAPVVSNWVPFYYSSAMVLGVFLIVLILLFQGMKLLPTGRKSTLYIFLYGSVVGLGTVVLHYFTGLVSSIMNEIGLSDEAYSSVAIFLIMGIILAGAWLGYWGVRKMVLSEDGSVDIGTAQFVKWAIRIVSSVMILQSSNDPLLATIALLLGIFLVWMVRSMDVYDLVHVWYTLLSLFDRGQSYNSVRNKKRPSSTQLAKAEFLSKNDTLLLRPQVGSPYRSSPISKFSPNKFRSPPLSNSRSEPGEQEYPSSFHKLPVKRRMSQDEWSFFTQKHTRKALQDLTASPKFADWFAANADRVMILPAEHREDRPADEIQSTAFMPQADENEQISRPRFFGF